MLYYSYQVNKNFKKNTIITIGCLVKLDCLVYYYLTKIESHFC